MIKTLLRERKNVLTDHAHAQKDSRTVTEAPRCLPHIPNSHQNIETRKFTYSQSQQLLRKREQNIKIHLLIPEKKLSLPEGENMMRAISTSQRTESS